jgi:hypothetical protein
MQNSRNKKGFTGAYSKQINDDNVNGRNKSEKGRAEKKKQL